METDQRRFCGTGSQPSFAVQGRCPICSQISGDLLAHLKEHDYRYFSEGQRREVFKIIGQGIRDLHELLDGSHVPEP